MVKILTVSFKNGKKILAKKGVLKEIHELLEKLSIEEFDYETYHKEIQSAFVSAKW